MQDDDLDLLLATAAKRPLVPSEALMERVLADGLAQQPQAPSFRTVAAPQPGFFARLASVFGGPPALAGLGTAAVFGLILGGFGCSKGYFTTGGAEGVGRATTAAVVVASLAILFSDFFLTKLLF